MEKFFRLVFYSPKVILSAVLLMAGLGVRIAQNLAVDVFPDISEYRVAVVLATDGAWLEVGAEVVRLVDPAALRIKALVSPAEIGKLADGLKCGTDNVTGELRIGLDAEAGLLPVYAIFPEGAPTAPSTRARIESAPAFNNVI